MMKRTIVIISLLLIGGIVFATGLNFEFGVGITVGDPNLLYAGVSTSIVFDKNFLNGQSCDFATQILLGYSVVTFGYGCIVKTAFKSPEKLEEFESIMSVGINFRINRMLSVLGSFTVNTKEELGLSIAFLFNLGIYTHPY